MSQDLDKRELLKDKVVSMIKDFVNKEGNLSFQDTINVLDKTKNTLHLTSISFSQKD